MADSQTGGGSSCFKKYSTNVCICTLGAVDHGKSSLVGEYLFETTWGGEKRRRHKNIVEMGWLGKTDKGSMRFSLSHLKGERERDITFHLHANEINVLCQDPSTKSWALGARPPPYATVIPSQLASSAASSSYKCSLFDIPGHRDFVKNAVRGVSISDVAVLVVSVKECEFISGLAPRDDIYYGSARKNTYEAPILQQLVYAYTTGIRRLIVAVNKMDLAAAEDSPSSPRSKKEVYDEAVAKLKKVIAKIFDLSLVEFVPVSSAFASDKRDPTLRAAAGTDQRDDDGKDHRNIVTRDFEEELGPETKCFAEVLHCAVSAIVEERRLSALRQLSVEHDIARAVVWQVYRIRGVGTVAVVKVFSGVFRRSSLKVSVRKAETGEGKEDDEGYDPRGGCLVTAAIQEKGQFRTYHRGYSMGGLKFDEETGKCLNFATDKLAIGSIEFWHQTIPEAVPGDFVGLALTGISDRQLAPGVILSGPPNDLQQSFASPSTSLPIPRWSYKSRMGTKGEEDDKKVFSSVLRRDPEEPNKLLPFPCRRKNLRIDFERFVQVFRVKVLVLSRPNGLREGSEMIARVGQQHFPCRILTITNIVRKKQQRHLPQQSTASSDQQQQIKPVVMNGERAMLTLAPSQISYSVGGYYHKQWSCPLIEQVNSPFANKGVHPNLSRIIFTDNNCVAAIGLVVDTDLDSDWGQEELFMNIICLRRVFPFELTHAITQYATKAAINPFR